MRLISAHVEKFRSIDDSGVVPIERDVTALVGKNESGKTAFLQALQRLNPVDPCKFTSLDYPRRLFSDAKKAGSIDSTVAITARLEIEPEDAAAFSERFGPGAVVTTEVTALRLYDNSLRIGQESPPDEAAAVAHVVDASGGDSVIQAHLRPATTMPELNDLLVELERPPGDGQPVTPEVAGAVALARAAIASMLGSSPDFETAVRGAIHERLPKFFYFSDYDFLEGRTDLARVYGGGQLTSGERVALSLMKLAGTDRDSLTDDEYEYRKAELEAVSNKLTSEMANYWSQSKDLEVVIDVDKAVEIVNGTPQPVARFLDVRVKDRRHGFTGNFNERSNGFRWFFSFLARFSEYEEAGERVVILLDEPGLTLHGRAQADFLRFIDERLAPNHQVIYTTHSPFMVPPGRLERVRLVEDKGVGEGSKIGVEVMATDPDTLFPLQAALGYDIAQNLFIAPHNLLVEGTSDYTYLYAVSDHVKALGRIGLDERWTVLPVGSVTKVSTFLALLGEHLDVTVLVDGGGESKSVADLVKKGHLASDRFITPAQVTGQKEADVEDLFDISDYLNLYNSSVSGAPLSQSDLSGTDRLVRQIKRARGDFSHGAPADYLLRNRDAVLPALSEASLGNFEQLFVKINATLPAT